MENMGYKNMQAVYDVNRAGRMAIRRGDNMTLNKNAELVLMFMASQTNSWIRKCHAAITRLDGVLSQTRLEW